MEGDQRNKKLIKISYFVLAILYLAFIFIDFSYPEKDSLSSVLKLSTIVIVFVIQLGYGRDGTVLWKLAAGLTVVTDYLLLFTDYYALGIFLFIIVQVLRLFYRKEVTNRQRPYHMMLLSLLIFVVLRFTTDRVNSLALIYAYFLFLNLIEAIDSDENGLILAYVLFLACDISVALLNISMRASTRGLAGKLVWIFYLPSQVLLARHIIKENFTRPEPTND